MRLLLIGERMNGPTWRPDEWPSLRGDRYWRLMLRVSAFNAEKSKAKLALIGLTEYDAVNLLPPDPQGVRWDSAKANEVAVSWLNHMREYDRCFLAGKRVAASLGVRGNLPDLVGKKLSVFGVKVTVIPHPSGLNRFWNDSAAVEELRERLSIILRERG